MLFQEMLSEIPAKCQIVWIQIWVQIVFNAYGYRRQKQKKKKSLNKWTAELIYAYRRTFLSIKIHIGEKNSFAFSNKNEYFKTLFIHLLRNFSQHSLMQVHMRHGLALAKTYHCPLPKFPFVCLFFSLSKSIQNTSIKCTYDFSTAAMYVLKHSKAQAVVLRMFDRVQLSAFNTDFFSI